MQEEREEEPVRSLASLEVVTSIKVSGLVESRETVTVSVG